MGARVDNPLIPPLTIDNKNNLKFLIMAEQKDATLNALVKAFNEMAPKGRQLNENSTFVGGSVSVGTTRKIKEFSCEVFTSQDGISRPWLAVIFDDGTKCSLRSLMGLPSLEGFSTEEAYSCDEYTGNVLPSGEREQAVRNIKATASGFDIASRYTPHTWCVNDFLNTEAPKLKGASVTYRGTALKPYQVRKPFGNQVPGGRAVISCDLWEVELPKVGAPTE